jgi:esterase/lipase
MTPTRSSSVPTCSLYSGSTERTDEPDTIVLIHGFWVTPRRWENWKAHYEQQGYRVLTPAYPGFEVEVEALNADPTRSRT